MARVTKDAPAPAEAAAPAKVQLRALCNFVSPVEGKVKQHHFVWVTPDRVDQLVNVVRCCSIVKRDAAD
ncbi:hypothetical protein JN531_012230 [Flagellatimonas centrodinii]|uniref:hypothetical protein n=1 Tax=Flagellatimonas centrodinii TaxID=2806210 RepID=UPI001FED48CC|nr:hypothetical protein [Flagellatimonas centrodinii]ULQ45868.1 hypothetical protein JN531_012230 [Flagellatimonas centrodinii]